MSKSSLYQTIAVSSGFFVYSLGFIQMKILTPIERFWVGTIFILLAILRNRIDSRTNKNSFKEVLFTHIYHFYTNVNNYVEWYDSGYNLQFIKKQKQSLDELEKYIEINSKKFTSRVIKRTNCFKDRLNEIVLTLWSNTQHSDQSKRYEVWKNVKFNIIDNEINPLYEQLKKDLAIK